MAANQGIEISGLAFHRIFEAAPQRGIFFLQRMLRCLQPQGKLRLLCWVTAALPCCGGSQFGCNTICGRLQSIQRYLERLGTQLHLQAGQQTEWMGHHPPT
jgi:hypothetical protein